MIYFLSFMYTYFTVLRCIISAKILINGLFSYWIFLTKKKMTILYPFLRKECHYSYNVASIYVFSSVFLHPTFFLHKIYYFISY